jgi:hypothetical protein
MERNRYSAVNVSSVISFAPASRNNHTTHGSENAT